MKADRAQDYTPASDRAMRRVAVTLYDLDVTPQGLVEDGRTVTGEFYSEKEALQWMNSQSSKYWLGTLYVTQRRTGERLGFSRWVRCPTWRLLK